MTVREAIARQGNRVINYDRAVDDARAALNRCLEDLHAAVCEGERACRRLEHLLSLPTLAFSETAND